MRHFCAYNQKKTYKQKQKKNKTHHHENSIASTENTRSRNLEKGPKKQKLEIVDTETIAQDAHGKEVKYASAPYQ